MGYLSVKILKFWVIVHGSFVYNDITLASCVTFSVPYQRLLFPRTGSQNRFEEVAQCEEIFDKGLFTQKFGSKFSQNIDLKPTENNGEES